MGLRNVFVVVVFFQYSLVITRFHSLLILETTHFLWPPIPIHALMLRPNHTLLEDISGGFCSAGRLQGFEPESFTSHGFGKKICCSGCAIQLGLLYSRFLLVIILGAMLETILELQVSTKGSQVRSEAAGHK